jgi:hypothetical protein
MCLVRRLDVYFLLLATHEFLNTPKLRLLIYMGETVELDTFDISFSFRCPKCDYFNEEVQAKDLSTGNAECGMCETVFKVEGLDVVKITATLE